MEITTDNNFHTVGEISVTYNRREKPTKQIKSSICATDYFKSVWGNQMEYKEKVMILMFNNQLKVLGHATISEGGINGSQVDNRVIFQHCLLANATSFMIAHNHPSGNTNPSQSDTKLTNKLKKAGKLMDIQMIDHLILTKDEGYYSFSDGQKHSYKS